jgi:hypothetical protein
VCCQQAGSGISSIAWHPQNNALLLGCDDGQYGLWVGPLQQQQQQGEGGPAASQLPSPWQPIDDVLKDADAAAAGETQLGGVACSAACVAKPAGICCHCLLFGTGAHLWLPSLA